jgi:hypothetical protein
MPGSFPPFVLFDNIVDRINQYPLCTFSFTAPTAPNREVKRIADYRRERTYMQAASATVTPQVLVDMGAGQFFAPDTMFIDRGHNLWGKEIVVEGGDDPLTSWFLPTLFNSIVPALDGSGNFVPGGDPTVGWSVTEEGAIYRLVPPHANLRRNWRWYVNGGAFQPLYTGVILGKRTQLDSYSRVLDEDAGGRKRSTDESDAGYTAGSRVYPYRTLMLDLGVIGATEYDTKIRLLRRALFEKQIPALVVMNYGRWPERAWLYQLDADRWNFPTNGVHRAGTIPLRELYPLIR